MPTQTIMVVDDSKSVRNMIQFSLSQAGYCVTEAENGRDALLKMKKQPVMMVITDLDMPEMGGMDLIRQIRSLPTCKQIPILVLTTESDVLERQKAKIAGANGWIVKPFKPTQLVAVARRFLADSNGS